MLIKTSIVAAVALLSSRVNGLLIPPDSRDLAVEDIPVFGGAIHESSSDRPSTAFSTRNSGSQLVFGAEGEEGDESKKDKSKRVPVVLGVMSKCPDAAACESTFDKIFSNVDHLMDLQTVYIGSLNSTSKPYGVTCKHGPQECDGNVQQLCVAAHVEKQKDWWNFIQCQNFESSSRIGDLSLAKQCAKMISANWDDDFSDCYTGKEGKKLLQDSVRLAKKMDITKSCSIYVNNRLACIHDGGVWKDCPEGHQPGDFENLIKEEHKNLNDN